jgi:hypothetical protein
MEPSAETPYPDGQQGLRVRARPGWHECLFEIVDRHGQALAHVVLEAPELDSLVRLVADLRAGLADRVPASLDPGARVVALVDPALKTARPTGTLPDGIILALRHPGLGWLAFLLPPPKAVALGTSLLQLAQSAPAARSRVAAPPGSAALTPRHA